ncbi:MAG: amidinotransferase, partial [Myxococcota bacterium]|nr:amidinotransferase [Myxococcota bacterium]
MQPGSTSLARAEAQHARLVQTLHACGATVRRHPFVRGCFDCVFAKDNAILARGPRGPRALLCRPRHPERAREQSARRRSLEAHGYPVDASMHALEGGDVVRVGGTLLLGHGFRSDPDAARQLASWSGLDVLELELIDPHLYHLDTALAALPDGTLLVCPDALAPASRRALRRCRHVRRVIDVA